ncbi:MAG: DUF2752 domain-containing protein [Armatimonadota bacterium]
MDKHQAVTDEPAVAHTPRSRFQRNNDIAWLAGSILVLAASFVLKPSPSGYGTHTQLWLPPCTFRMLTRIPCPSCGMTTSFCYISRLQVAQALEANVLGPLAYLLVLLQIPYRIYSLAVRPLDLRLRHDSPWLMGGLVALIVLAWAANIYLDLR